MSAGVPTRVTRDVKGRKMGVKGSEIGVGDFAARSNLSSLQGCHPYQS